MDNNTSGYELVDVPFEGDRVRVMQLVPSSNPSRTPLSQFGKKGQNRQASLMLLDTLNQISSVSLSTSYKTTRTVKRLDGPVVEVRVPHLTVRALSYNRDGEDVLVILDVIEGHKGTDKIPPKTMKEAKKKARIAESLLNQAKAKNQSETQRTES